MYDLALECLNQLPADALRNPIIQPLATNYGQSGFHVAYYFRKALKEINPSLKTKEIFPAVKGKNPGNGRTNAHRLFVDDFVGINGSQAKDYLSELVRGSRSRLPENAIVYYLALAGFEQGRLAIEEWAREEFGERLIIEVKLGHVIRESDRPFSPNSEMFGSVDEREKAREMAFRIGMSILPDLESYNTVKDARGNIELAGEEVRELHALGWEGSQALVAFPHNVPNNTLPVVWANGSYKGRNWIPLFPRLEA